ncbi:tail protein X [Acidaminococcus intestini]
MTDTYKTVQGDMWDLIAYKVYGAEDGAAALLRANPDLADIVVLPAGVTVKVPAYDPPKTNLLPPWRRT